MFELITSNLSSRARRGRLATAHGEIDTPAFIPVGTQGSVKAVSPRELRELKAQIILGNTYHLFVRPGINVIKHFSGLHRFMNWHDPILTDSGGYQIFSLAKLRKITEEGVHFQNHVDGTPAFISPEIAMEIQAALGSDIAMVLDECAPYPCEREYAEKSLEMTTRWAKRSKAANAQRSTLNPPSPWTGSALASVQGLTEEAELSAIRNPQSAIKRQLLFGIVQGATFDDLRKASAQAIVDLSFDGYAIGGVSVGEPEEEMMGAILDKDPIEQDCACPACREFTRGYVRHLIKAEEILGLRLITLHNLHFYFNLMKRTRAEVEAGTFDEFRKNFVSNYKTREVDPA